MTTLWDRLVAWWHAPASVEVDAPEGQALSVSVAGGDTGDTYAITLQCGEDVRVIEVRRRWWHSNRAIARKLRREIEGVRW